MNTKSNREIAKQLCKEMGIKWDDEATVSTVSKIPLANKREVHQMKTEKEIKDRAIQEAMQHTFSGYNDINETKWTDTPYEYLQKCSYENPGDDPDDLLPWEPYQYMGSRRLLEIVDGLIYCYEEAMKWAQGMSTIYCHSEHEFYYDKEHDWHLHVNIRNNSAMEMINRQLMTFDRNGNVIKDPRLDDDVWQFEFEPCYDIKLENEAVFNSFSTTDEEYEIRLAESGILEQINKK